jgi:hypothetical protein
MKTESYNQGYWDTDILISMQLSSPMIQTLIQSAADKAYSMKNYLQGCEDRLNESVPNQKSLR